MVGRKCGSEKQLQGIRLTPLNRTATTPYNKQGLIMDKLIAIAKECGAVVMPKGTQVESVILKDAAVVLTPAELHATIEQVCAPLVEALENYRESEMHGLGAVFNTPAKEALATYNAIMGDKK